MTAPDRVSQKERRALASRRASIHGTESCAKPGPLPPDHIAAFAGCLRRNRDFSTVTTGLKALSAAGDPLERLAQVIDFEVFRGDLESALSRSDRTKGGRPPYNPC